MKHDVRIWSSFLIPKPWRITKSSSIYYLTKLFRLFDKTLGRRNSINQSDAILTVRPNKHITWGQKKQAIRWHNLKNIMHRDMTLTQTKDLQGIIPEQSPQKNANSVAPQYYLSLPRLYDISKKKFRGRDQQPNPIDDSGNKRHFNLIWEP